MNKKIIGVISLSVLLISLGVFVCAINWSAEMGPITLHKGWNLVYGLQTPDQLDGQVLQRNNIKAIYAFIPTTQEYLRAWPNPDGQSWQNLDNIFDDHELLQTAFWVYVDNDATTEYWLYDLPASIEGRKMYAGWNFVGITHDMLGSGGKPELRDLAGTCNIQKTYFFDPRAQEWVMFPLDEDFSDGALNSGILIKVSHDCKMGEVKEDISAPPTLP